MDKRRSLFIILLLGLIWGIIECTLGWFMHITHIHSITPILISFGIVCMGLAVYFTKKPVAALLVSTVAAIIKLLNIFMLSGQSVMYVVSPAIHIFIEGLIITGAILLLLTILPKLKNAINWSNTGRWKEF